jgi:hypothetical protein
MRHSIVEVFYFTVSYPISLLSVFAVGYLLAKRNYRRRAQLWKLSGIESALITIFGLLLFFTLLASNNSLRDRTTLIQQTSDAVTDLYQESQLLPQPSLSLFTLFNWSFGAQVTRASNMRIAIG